MSCTMARMPRAGDSWSDSLGIIRGLTSPSSESGILRTDTSTLPFASSKQGWVSQRLGCWARPGALNQPEQQEEPPWKSCA